MNSFVSVIGGSTSDSGRIPNYGPFIACCFAVTAADPRAASKDMRSKCESGAGRPWTGMWMFVVIAT